MRLIQCRFSSGQRLPLLVQAGDATPLPTLIPFIYVQLKLRHRAYNTAAAHLRAIQAFYAYAKSRDLDIDEAILACHFEAILALLDGYAIWLQSGRHADNLIARIGKPGTVLSQQISSRTRDQYPGVSEIGCRKGMLTNMHLRLRRTDKPWKRQVILLRPRAHCPSHSKTLTRL